MTKKVGRPSNASKLLQQAKDELKRREEASKDILKFADYMTDDFKVGRHTKKLGDILTAIANGEQKFLLLSVPPRHGKSYLVSELFPAFFLGLNPKKKLITASCTSDLSMEFARKVRNSMSSEEYKRVFPTVSLAKDSNRQDKFNTEAGGGLLSAGTGSLITGFGGHVLVVDDPIKGSSDAKSPNLSEKLWLWYRTELRTRAMPGASVVVVQTRWAETDLVGRLVEQKEQGLGDDWEVLNMPVYNEDGSPLWPEVFSKKEIESVRQTMGDTEFNCVYMGNPTPEGGTFFQRAEIMTTDDYPTDGHYYISCDLAASEKGDYTVFVVAHMSKSGQLCIVDGYRGRVSPDVWIAKLVSLVKKYKPHRIFQESGPIYSSVEKYILAAFRDAGTFALMEKITSYKNKEGKAQSLKAGFADRKVLLYDTPFCEALLDELISFPNGRNDDMVDAASMLTNALGDRLFSHKRSNQKKRRRRDYDGSSFLDKIDSWKII